MFRRLWETGCGWTGKTLSIVTQWGRWRVLRVGPDTRDSGGSVTDPWGGNIVKTMVKKSKRMSYTERQNVNWLNVQVGVGNFSVWNWVLCSVSAFGSLHLIGPKFTVYEGSKIELQCIGAGGPGNRGNNKYNYNNNKSNLILIFLVTKLEWQTNRSDLILKNTGINDSASSNENFKATSSLYLDVNQKFKCNKT